MGRRSAVASFLIAGLLAGGADAPDLSAIHAARWLAPGADRARALGTVRPECLAPVRDPDQRYLVEVGRAAFRTPLLLGGQAADAGIACVSCHQGGRSNPDFFFPGLSGAPGTADVTSALFSTHRDDGIDNPKPIPDLTSQAERDNIARNLKGPALAHFIDGLVTEEFEGPEPPPQVLAGLAAYVRALSPAACPAQAREPLRAEAYLDTAERAVRTAGEALKRGDAPTAAVMIEAARSQLGLVYERYDQPASAPARAQLRAADLDLQATLTALRAGDAKAGDRLAVWLATAPTWRGVVTGDEDRSLFNPVRLAAASR